MTPTITCTDCGNDIQTGEQRHPTNNGTIHGFCQTRREARDAFRFYLTDIENSDDDVKAYGFWRQYDDYEFPILTHNSGQTMMASQHKFVGDDGIKPSEEFITAFGYTLHWLLCYDHGYVKEEVEDTITDFYDDGEVPDHERWALHYLLGDFLTPSGPLPELEPLREFAVECTEMPVPEIRETNE